MTGRQLLALIRLTLAMLTASTTVTQGLSMVKQGREASNREQPTAMMARVQGASCEKEKAALSAAFF